MDNGGIYLRWSDDGVSVQIGASAASGTKVVASRFEYNEPSRTTDVAICAGVLAVHFKIMVNIQISMKDGRPVNNWRLYNQNG